FFDIGARNKSAAGADKNNSASARVSLGSGEGLVQGADQRGPEGVHGWIIDGDDGDVAVVGNACQLSHADSIVSLGSGRGGGRIFGLFQQLVELALQNLLMALVFVERFLKRLGAASLLALQSLHGGG